MNDRFSALALVIFWIGNPPDAQALQQSCGPLKQVAALKMSVLPDGSRVSVPLTIDGKAVSLLVDTGAGMSSLTKPTATMLGIRQRDSEKMQLIASDGAAIHHYYLADNFQFGRLTAKNVPFMQNVDIDNADVGGAIGPDLMLRYDVDMDFSEQKLSYFSQDHCPGHIVHWQTGAVNSGTDRSCLARQRLPASTGERRGGRSFARFRGHGDGVDEWSADSRHRYSSQGDADGHAFTADIDTGLDISTINSKAAQDYFDVPLDDHQPEVLETHQPQARSTKSSTETVTVTARRQQHQFHSLTFGGVTVTNPLFVLKPGPMGVHRRGPDPPDITIGMNVLRKLHLYFAFRERNALCVHC